MRLKQVRLPDEQWSKIVGFLHICPDLYVGKEDDCRRFVEAVLWITRSGAQRRLLPDEYGNWNSVYQPNEGIALKVLACPVLNSEWQIACRPVSRLDSLSYFL